MSQDQPRNTDAPDEPIAPGVESAHRRNERIHVMWVAGNHERYGRDVRSDERKVRERRFDLFAEHEPHSGRTH